MTQDYYLYKKTTEDSKDLIALMNDNGFPLINCHCAIDTNRDFINYNELKIELQINPGILFINSLHTIGYTKQQVLEELMWFSDNNIQLIIMDMPSTWIFDNPKANLQCIKVLIDMFRLLLKYNNFEFQNPDFIEGGRKKIKFPANWDELYEQYNSKQISATEFQEAAGLKRATFFNLLAEYKELIKLNTPETKQDAVKVFNK